MRFEARPPFGAPGWFIPQLYREGSAQHAVVRGTERFARQTRSRPTGGGFLNRSIMCTRGRPWSDHCGLTATAHQTQCCGAKERGGCRLGDTNAVAVVVQPNELVAAEHPL